MAALYLVRWLIYTALYWVLLWLFKQSPAFKKAWPILMVTTAGLVAFFGFVQYFVWPDLRMLKPLGWDPHYFRLTSTFIDPGFTGMILVLAILLLFDFSRQKLNRQRKNLFYLLGVVLYLALALTYARSAYLALVAGGFVYAVYKKGWRLFLGGFLVLLITLVLLPRPFGEGVKLERTVSVLARLGNWQRSAYLAQKKPVLGYGFNTLRSVKNEPVSHAGAGVDASLLFVLLTTGWVGLAAYLFLLQRLWLSGGLVFKASLLAALVHSFFNNTMFYAPVMFWLWSLAAWEES